MIDPSSIIGYSLMGAGSGLVNRVMQHWFPTPLEKAQTDSISANLELARERLQVEEKRLEREWDVRRELLLRQINANQEVERDRDLMRRWPLEVPAAAFIRFSQKRRGTALNVIIRPTVRRSVDPQVEQRTSLLKHFYIAADALIASVPRYFHDDVLFYRETERAEHAPHPVLHGQQLTSTIYSLTGTEPTLLLEISPSGPTELTLAWSCWGWCGDEGEPEQGSICVDVGGDSIGRPSCIETALLVLVCAMNDRFQTISRLSSSVDPRLFHFINIHAQPRFYKSFSAGALASEAADAANRRFEQTATDLLISSYGATLVQIAKQSPTLAAECAAKSAIIAAAQGNKDIAEAFLTVALNFCRDAAPQYQAEESKLISSIMRQRYGKSASNVRNALIAIRKLEAQNYIEVNAKMTPEEILARLEEFENKLSPEERKKLRDKLTEMLTYKPKIGIFGKCGVGKSSLCNALFGKDAFKVSDIEACTRKPQTVLLEIGKANAITLLDVPGVGESRERDQEYSALYKSLLPNVDAIVWVLKADDRAFTIDEDFYLDVVKPHIDKGMPFIVALNQVDKIQPFREWDVDGHRPGPSQEQNIDLKRDSVAKIFKIKKVQVVGVSAEERFGLSELVDRIVLSLPDVKRTVTAMSVAPEYISNTTRAAVEESIDREVGTAVGTGVGALIGTILIPVPIVGTVVGAALGGAVGWGLSVLRKWLS